MSVIRKMHSLCVTDLDKHIADLTTGAIFFAMRSCEYSKTCTNEESKRTKVLRLLNIQFYRGDELIPHDSPFLDQADVVCITFEDQKNAEKNEQVNNFQTGYPLMCPVRAWIRVVRRVRSYRNTSDDSKVNTFEHKGSLQEITSFRIKTKLRAAAAVIGQSKLGFSPNDIGTHSIRAGGVMAMYLNGIPSFTIQLIGRWESDAFLKYIRKQVQSFSRGVSNRMILQENFFTTPDFHPGGTGANKNKNGPRLESVHGGFTMRIPSP